MSISIRGLPVGSAEELLALLPAVSSEGSEHTLAYNLRRHRGFQQVVLSVRATSGLVADNDGTVIPGSQWDDLRRHMCEPLRIADEADVVAYFRGERTDDGDAAFLMRGVERLRASGLTRAHIREEATAQKPRPGTRALFESYGMGHMTAIVSFGLDAYISEWSNVHEIPVEEIHAAQLHWQRSNGGFALVGCERGTVVVEANKMKAREAFSRRRRLADRQVLVLEDTPRMLARMKHPDNVGVLVIPRNDSESKRSAERMRQLREPGLFENIDAFLISDSLESLVEFRS